MFSSSTWENHTLNPDIKWNNFIVWLELHLLILALTKIFYNKSVTNYSTGFIDCSAQHSTQMFFVVFNDLVWLFYRSCFALVDLAYMYPSLQTKRAILPYPSREFSMIKWECFQFLFFHFDSHNMNLHSFAPISNVQQFICTLLWNLPLWQMTCLLWVNKP